MTDITPVERQVINVLTMLEDDIKTRFTGIVERIACDPRWLAIARTHFDEGFMAARRAVRDGKRTDE